MILYVSWELNESLQKLMFRHENNGLHMLRSNPVAVDCFVSFDWSILEKLEKSTPLSFMSSF